MMGIVCLFFKCGLTNRQRRIFTVVIILLTEAKENGS